MNEPLPLSFRLRDDGVGVIIIDVPKAKQNTVNERFIRQLPDILSQVSQSGAQGVVILSNKPGSFLAGADIEYIRRFEDPTQAIHYSRETQKAINDIADGDLPFVAAVHGACLGGGLELILACRGRIATDDPTTRLGLPEVKLGLLPAAGGTQRLPRTIGIEAALDLMVTGKSLDAPRAKKIGLVHEVVPPAILEDVAAKMAKELASHAQDRTLAERLSELTDPKVLREIALGKNPAGRNLVFTQAEKLLRKKAGKHFPAPYEILRVAKVGLDKGLKKGLEAETIAFGELLGTDVARRLIEIFSATRALKKDNGTAQPNLAPKPLRKIGVIGAGAMGRDIAYMTINSADLDVRLVDRDDTHVGNGLSAIRKRTEAFVKKRTHPRAVEHRLMRVSGCTDRSGLKTADIIIESVFEDLDLKRDILRSVEAIGRPDTIFATTTSSLSVAAIAEAAKRPDRVVGMHYLAAGAKVPLLEVVRTDHTSDEVVATCVALGKRQGKTVIVVKDGVGFYTNRIFGAYLVEAGWMIKDGIPIETIDAAARTFGLPLGPVMLLDEVGLDVVAQVQAVAEAAFGPRMSEPDALSLLLEDGRLGRKSKKGFYLYEKDRTKRGAKEVDPSVYNCLGITPDKRRKHDLTELGTRLILPLVAEAIRCLEDGIVRNPRDGDVGAILGAGFPPFRGGPFRMADAMGPAELLRQLRLMEEQHGPRFAPPNLLVSHAGKGQRFYDA